MRRTVKHLATATVVPLLALGLVACGEEGGATAGKKAVAADTATASESPSEETVDEPTGDEVDPDDFTQRLIDGYDEIETASFTMEMSGGGFDMSGTGVADYRVTPPSTRMDMTGAGLGGDATIISVDKQMYVKVDGQGQKYMKMDLDQTGMTGLGSTDPAEAMKMFSEGVTAVREIGDETVDGVDTTHYEVDVDAAKLKEQAGGGTLPDELTFEVWLDDQDRTVKFVMDLDASGTMTMQMGDFGEPVEITAPPASQVQEMPGA